MSHEQGAKEVRATVTKVVRDGQKVPYVVTRPEKADLLPEGSKSITFAVKDWSGRQKPLHGQTVVLSNIEQFHNGWRARSARPVTL